MLNSIRRGFSNAVAPPTTTGSNVFSLSASFDQHSLPDRELYAQIGYHFDSKAEASWAKGSSPEEFWTSLFTRGIIHHRLFSQARWLLNDPATIPTPTQAEKGRVSLSNVLIPLSHSPPGRELIVSFLRNLSTIQSYRLADVTLPDLMPEEGSVPLLGPHTFTPTTVHAFAIDAADHTITRWWKKVESLLTLDGAPLCSAPPSYEQRNLSTTLKFLSLNVWGVPGLSKAKSIRFPRIAESLRSGRYDLVALQEMWDPASAEIITNSGMPYAATSSGYPGLTSRSGLVILSRLPLADIEELTFTSRGGIERVVSKGALAGRITKEDGSTVLVVNTHLVSPPERGSSLLCSTERSETIRESQIIALRNWLHQLRRPGEELIVLGDFNSPEQSRHYTLLRDTLGYDLFRERLPLVTGNTSNSIPGSRLGLTFEPLTNPRARRTPAERLDYCFATFSRPELVDIAARRTHCTQDTFVSDHFGIEFSITWQFCGE